MMIHKSTRQINKCVRGTHESSQCLKSQCLKREWNTWCLSSCVIAIGGTLSGILSVCYT